MAKVLITRISSFGDVAILVPVVFSVAARYPQDRFIVLTRKAFAPLFENLGFNIHAITFDNKKHSGTFGTLRLLFKVGNYGFSHVADVHDVLRSKLIRKYMFLLGKKVRHIDKGRGEKRHMIQTKKLTPPLIPTTDRYMDVFQRLGFNAEMIFKNYFEFEERSLYPLRNIVSEKEGNWVGVAPFSKHQEKMYPLERVERIVEKLANTSSTTVFLFGAGSEEKEILDLWEKKYTNVINVSGKVKLVNELLLISYLDVMLSMDSANMHLASLVETPVVSIWGATHPNLGFYGYGQKEEDIIQTDIDCRPCSVYGEIPCKRGDYACLTKIKEETVLSKIYEYLKIDKTESPASDIADNAEPEEPEIHLSVDIDEIEMDDNNYTAVYEKENLIFPRFGNVPKEEEDEPAEFNYRMTGFLNVSSDDKPASPSSLTVENSIELVGKNCEEEKRTEKEPKKNEVTEEDKTKTDFVWEKGRYRI